eukprot:jgi/Bigna1/126326/aug1.2_g1034
MSQGRNATSLYGGELSDGLTIRRTNSNEWQLRPYFSSSELDPKGKMSIVRHPEVFPPDMVEPILSKYELPQHTILNTNKLRDIIRDEFKQDVDEDVEGEGSSERTSQAFSVVRYGKPELPGSLVHFHFFEPRYKVMIKEAMEEREKRFLYLYTRPAAAEQQLGSEEGESLIGQCGVVLSVEECLFEDDGRANIRAICGPRIRVTDIVEQRVFEGSPLSELSYETITDTPPTNDEDRKEIAETARHYEYLVHEIYRYIPRVRIETQLGIAPSSSHPENFSLWLAKWLQGNDYSAQGLSLETEKTLVRLKSFGTTLEKIHDTLKAKNEAE